VTKDTELQGNVNVRADMTNVGLVDDVPVFEKLTEVLELVGLVLELELVDVWEPWVDRIVAIACPSGKLKNELSSSELQQLPDRFPSQQYLPSEHFRTASLPGAVLSRVG
jgi:hypothetical protein